MDPVIVVCRIFSIDSVRLSSLKRSGVRWQFGFWERKIAIVLALVSAIEAFVGVLARHVDPWYMSTIASEAHWWWRRRLALVGSTTRCFVVMAVVALNLMVAIVRYRAAFLEPVVSQLRPTGLGQAFGSLLVLVCSTSRNFVCCSSSWARSRMISTPRPS